MKGRASASRVGLGFQSSVKLNAEGEAVSDEGCSETNPREMCDGCKKGYYEARGFDLVASTQVEAFDANRERRNIDTEAVVEMIDAITEGKNYSRTWESAGLSDNLHVALTKDIVRFGVHGEVFDIDNPRTAREIAGALIAWADRKERETQKQNYREAYKGDNADNV